MDWEGENMVEDLIQDAKFYQDTTLELQGAYEDLYQQQESNYKVSMMNNQSFLKKHPQLLKLQMLKLIKRHQALLDVQCNKDRRSLDQAIQEAVQQYKVQCKYCSEQTSS